MNLGNILLSPAASNGLNRLIAYLVFELVTIRLANFQSFILVLKVGSSEEDDS